MSAGRSVLRDLLSNWTPPGYSRALIEYKPRPPLIIMLEKLARLYAGSPSSAADIYADMPPLEDVEDEGEDEVARFPGDIDAYALFVALEGAYLRRRDRAALLN